MRAVSIWSKHRPKLAKQLVLLGCAAWAALGCSTKAIAIQQCREIESLRCEASASCGVIDEDEVESCIRFYNDQCLHGIAGPEEPTANEQKQCLDLLDDSNAVAKENQDDPEGNAYQDACGVIAAPWDQEQCRFLEPDQGGGGAGSEDDEDEDEDEDK